MTEVKEAPLTTEDDRTQALLHSKYLEPEQDLPEDRGGRGLDVESRVVSLEDLEIEDHRLYDAYHYGLGMYVEVKSCKAWYSNGAAGRLQIYQQRHQDRKEAPEHIRYTLAVYGQSRVLYTTLTISEVEDLLEQHDLSWSRNDNKGVKGPKAKISWRHWLPEEYHSQVERWGDASA